MADLKLQKNINELRQGCARLNELIFDASEPEVDEIVAVVTSISKSIAKIRKRGLPEHNIRVSFGAAILAEIVPSTE